MWRRTVGELEHFKTISQDSILTNKQTMIKEAISDHF